MAAVKSVKIGPSVQKLNVSITHIYTKARGVNFRNPDGVPRQKFIEDCASGDALELQHENNNVVDPNAMAVLTRAGNQVGYLSADLAAMVVRDSTTHKFGVMVLAKTGFRGKRGLNVVLIKARKTVTQKALDDYIARWIDFG